LSAKTNRKKYEEKSHTLGSLPRREKKGGKKGFIFLFRIAMGERIKEGKGQRLPSRTEIRGS